MKSGIVKLIRKKQVIKQLRYYSVSERKEIVKTWSHLVGMKFLECAIHIKPDIDKRFKD